MPLAGQPLTFTTIDRGKTVTIGNATTGSNGTARWPIPSKYVGKTIRVITAGFAGNATYLPSSDEVTVSR